MSATGSVSHNGTQIDWDEQHNRVTLRIILPDGPHVLFMTYDKAREVLDCLMTIFARQELTLRYPEVK